MKKITAKDIQEYLLNNYVKVDGLWFIKIEEHYGFEKALELDREVWQVLPKLQARFLKKKLSLDNSIHDLLEALKIKMKIDGFKFKPKIFPLPEEVLQVEISFCPWHSIMIKSKRENLSEKIGSLICKTEYTAFAKEFIKGPRVEIKEQICSGCKKCVFLIYPHVMGKGG